MSSLNLLIVPVLDPGFWEHYHRFREKAYTIFNEFIRKGNLISVFRRSELQQLEDMLVPFIPLGAGSPTAAGAGAGPPAGAAAAAPTDDEMDNHNEQLDNQRQDDFGRDTMSVGYMLTPAPPAHVDPAEESNIAAMTPAVGDFTMDTWFSTAQMIDIANSIANSDTEWMSQNIIAHDI